MIDVTVRFKIEGDHRSASRAADSAGTAFSAHPARAGALTSKRARRSS